MRKKTGLQAAHLQILRATAQAQNCQRAIFLTNIQIQYIFKEIEKDLLMNGIQNMILYVIL